ncbi:MAG: transglycosylase domain-containing protein, partial [Lachnospiraceae bacterium]|nr:transglycosylase domain-containing protein [Lachnospiraceae bacterium]
KIDDVPLNMQEAFIAIEDSRFYDHHGIDPKGIMRAAFVGIKGVLSGGGFTEGASTITQQLLKNNVFTGWTAEKGFADKVQRKIQEMYLAVQLEKEMEKPQILENYLNTINLGQNTLGVQAASYRYFDKPVSELTLSECSVIAGITKSPSSYNPITNPEKNAERREKVLNDMMEQGYITKEEYDEALADDVYSRIQEVNKEVEESASYNTYFVDETIEQVMSDLENKLGYSHNQAYNLLYSGGLKIYTTQDPKIQAICDEEYTNPENYPAGTEVCLDFALTIRKADDSTVNHSIEMLVSHFKKQGENGARGKSTSVPFSALFASEESALDHVARYKEAVMEPGDEILGERVEITPQPQTSLVLLDQSTGYVKAIVGGRGDKTGNLTLNRATNVKRTPGSTFKVVGTYAPAIDAYGYTIADGIDDAPYQYESGQPVYNFNQDRYHGMTSIRDNIVHSYNIPAVKVLTDITPAAGFDYAKNKFHIDSLIEKETRYVWENGQKVSKTFSDAIQSMALGGLTDGVTNLELTAAYGTFGNEGMYNEPVFYTKVVDHDGNVILDNTNPEPERAIKETTAWLLTDVMKEVLTRGTSTIARFAGMAQAGKSGTSNDFRDVWFVGYTPYYTCGVWSGIDSNEPLASNARNFHKVFWKKVMTRVHADIPNTDFTKPSDIETGIVCKKSGKLAVPGLCDVDPRGSMVTTEYFEKGTVPTDYCDVHIRVSICSSSNMLASQYCPENKRITASYIRRPDPAEGETDDTPFTMPTEGAPDLPTNLCPIHVSDDAPSVSLDSLLGGNTGENTGEDTGDEED